MMVDNEPVVIDFGIAHLVDESRITITGLVMGTRGYLSPEVVEGMEITDATDWWGWAATVAYAATGRPPFGTGSGELVMDRVRRGRVDLDRVPEPLGSMLTSVLTAEISERWTGTQIRRWLGLEPDPASVTVEATTVRSPAPGGSAEDRTVAFTPPGRDPSEEVTLRYPAPTDAGLERTVRYPPPAPAADLSATSFDSAPAVPTLALPVEYPAPVSQPAAWPPVRPPQRNDAERLVIVPPNPYPPPGVPAGQGPVDTVPGQDPAAGPAGIARDQTNRFFGPVRPTGTILLGALAVAGLASVAPGGVVVVSFIIMVVARTIDRSATLLWRRRSTSGPRAGDIPVAVVSLPWQVTLSAASSLLSLILPVLIAISVAFIVGTSVSSDLASGPSSPITLAAAALAGMLTGWWGPGGGSFRRGTRTAARWAIKGTAGRIITWSLLVLMVVSAVLVSAQGEPVDWAPFPSPGTLFLTEP
jgi:hypothetical protein